MIKPSWDIFKAKFSENHQNNFEWFCYLLFCQEFNQRQGIFRYVNHSGMETNPVKIGDEFIAWEAKFYEDKLSDHKDEFIRKLEITKNKNPETTKMVFYTPIDWTESSKTTKRTTKQQDEIEKYAQDKNIKIVWKGASFFESPFVSIQNEIISKHFFSLDKSVFALIKAQQIHSENILNEIQTSITFCGQNIEIDRSKDLAKLKNNGLEKALILSGTGGVGKTAIVKNLYSQLKGTQPFYIFKATEFELRSINDLFSGLDFQDFVEVHKDETHKIIVIDSAEKLLDLKNTDPFKEFLLILIQNNWKLIFTTRDNYLEDLNYEFFEIYKITPLNINISNIDIDELNKISSNYKFVLPKDERLLEFIKNPFYLGEYLKYYKADEEIAYIDFKEKLWNKNIRKSKPAREQCFLKIAFQRANDGQFFINPICESQILDNELKRDGILGYESPHGYFITHDIYEEWALEKIIEAEFIRKSNNQEFFKRIGQSLPIRRSFRNWLSDKLLLAHLSIKDFIDEVIKDHKIESHWKDATLVAVLLSDHSDIFFELFKENLKENNCELLKRITFLLRIACKEVDDDFFKQLGVKSTNLFSMKYVLTKPRGKGWQSLIKFVFENLDNIGIKNIFFVLPIIHDWNSKFKEGATTKYSSLIALHYYQWTIKENVYFDRDGTKDDLLQTILYGSSEIKNELKEILEEILKNKWKNHRDPYHDLSQVILTKLEGITISKVLPKNVLQLADLFWSYTPVKNDSYYHSRMGLEQYYGLEDEHLNYFPASSYQTPIYWLLQFSLQETVDFILKFTNKTVECFAKSDFAKNEVEEVEVFIEEDKSIKQYISNRIWCTYRGTQVSPHVLESMHMALEKYFLEIGKHADSKILESWLLYLLKNSKSASVSAVVTSIVLAYPEKTFNVAKILFKTKGFFHYDTARFTLDLQHKSSLLILRDSFGINYERKSHEDERLKACDDKHRNNSLEQIFVYYQFFRSGETSEEEAHKRQAELWEILDNYYKDLPKSSEENASDKIWRLYLARMDKRKMKPTTEETDGGILINFNPEIDPELKKYSETSLEKSSAPMKYASLSLWANYKISNDDKYKTYEQYEKNPKLALKEVEEIISKLKITKRPKSLELHHSEEESFYLFNHTIPAHVCSVLVRDHFQQLSREERTFCKDIILEVAFLPFLPNYQYQISDGTQSAISVLPFLINEFPEEKEDIKIILLLTLFNDYPVDMGGTTFSTFSIMAIHALRENNPNDAESIFFGYLLLKSKYEKLRKKLFKENHQKGIYELHENQIIEKFLKENEISLKKVVENKISKDDLEDITKLDLNILRTAFLLIPQKTDNKEYKEIVKKIICAFAKKLLLRDRDDKIDYRVRHDFLKKYSYFVLNSPKEEIPEYLKSFLDRFNSSEAIADLFEEFILIEDNFNLYENFWEVWNLFKNKVIELCKDGDGFWYVERIVKSYLFAQTRWKETTVEWHTLKGENKIFFKEMSEKLGHCPSSLYAISKLLNDIGSPYLNDGISWISSMLDKNKNLLGAKLENNTIYHLENLIRKYIYKNREKIRKTQKLKGEVLIILNFLIEKGSVVGYMLRENIL
jgi:hypothetical protein